MLKKLLAKKKTVNVGKGEVKITIMVIYTIAIVVTGLVNFVYFDVNDSFGEDLTEYILCESTGTSPDCVLDSAVSDIVSNISSATDIMLASIPVVVLLMNCDVTNCKGRNTQKRNQVTLHNSN